MTIFYDSKNLRNGFLYLFFRSLALPTLVFLAFFVLHLERSVHAQQLPRPLYIMNVDGTGLKQLVDLPEYKCCGSPIWTQDGKQILFDAFRTNETYFQSHAFVVNADGKSPQDLGPGALPSGDPTKPRRFAMHCYAEKNGLWLGAKDSILINRNAGSPRWHPHEAKLAYLNWGGGIAMREIKDAELGEEKMLVSADHSPAIGFSWSPDGKAIAFLGKERGSNELKLLTLNVTEKESKPEVLATGKIGKIVSWSSDGKKIAFDKLSFETNTQQIFIAETTVPETAPSEKAPPKKVSPLKGQAVDRNNVSPAWSLDGKQIVFASRESMFNLGQ